MSRATWWLGSFLSATYPPVFHSHSGEPGFRGSVHAGIPPVRTLPCSSRSAGLEPGDLLG